MRVFGGFTMPAGLQSSKVSISKNCSRSEDRKVIKIEFTLPSEEEESYKSQFTRSQQGARTNKQAEFVGMIPVHIISPQTHHMMDRPRQPRPARLHLLARPKDLNCSSNLVAAFSRTDER